MSELSARFARNVLDARDNGFDLVCAQCGCGMNDDDFEDAEMHEKDCPNRGRDRDAEMAAFLERRLGANTAAELAEILRGRDG